MERAPTLSESIDRREYQPSVEVIGAFFSVSPETLQVFKNRLVAVQGHARIWVHPLYTEQWPGSAQGRLGEANLAEVQEKLRSTFFKTADSVVRSQNSAPLIVFEAVKKIVETKHRIAEHVGCDVNELQALGIIFVPTEAGSSDLDDRHLIQSLQVGSSQSDMLAAEAMMNQLAAEEVLRNTTRQHRSEVHEAIPGLAKDFLYLMTKEESALYLSIRDQQIAIINPLREKVLEAKADNHFGSDAFIVSVLTTLGMKSALVSGGYLEVGTDYATKEPVLTACAGSVVSRLRTAGFPIDISSNIWPPKDLIRAAGFELKQTNGLDV